MDYTLNLVLRASICWIFRTHDPQFSNQITPLLSCNAKYEVTQWLLY